MFNWFFRALLALSFVFLSTFTGTASAQTRYEYTAAAFQEFGSYVRDAASPGAACASYASIWGWDRNGFTAQLIQRQAGEWACQRFHLGVIDAGQVTTILGQCQVKAVPLSWLSGRFVSAPIWDKAAGVCVCDLPHIFNTEIQWCEIMPQQYSIALTGASRTKALVAGPALVQYASVTNNGAAASGVGVSIQISNGTSISGTTDSRGQFAFTYVPPYRAVVDHLSATCTNCSNTAQKDITVDACDVCEGAVGNPISSSTGEKLQAETDWADSSPNPLTITRSYRSFGAQDAQLGANWVHSWSATITLRDADAVIQTGEARRITFRRSAAGQPWAAEATADTLTQSGTGTVWHRASDGATFTFDAQGKLQSITQRNGWTMTITRDTLGRIASVTNVFGRQLVFGYDSAGRIAAIGTPDGAQIAYGYDGANRLSAVTLPGGATRGYAYENAQFPAALTGIVDERGVRIATFTYNANGLAVATEHAGAQRYTVSNPRSGAPARGQLGAGTTINAALLRTSVQVSDPLGTSRSYEFVGGNGTVRLAGASDAGGVADVASRSLDGANLVQQESDFAGVTTAYTWDAARRLNTSTTEASGLAQSRTRTTDWHAQFDLPVRITEAGRTTEYDYDALGNQLSEAVTDTASGAKRTRKWSYGPNSLATSMTDALGGMWKYGYDSAGNRNSITDPLGQVTSLTFDGAGRITSQREGGVTSFFTYDARGHLLEQSRGGEVTRYAYTPTGRLASATLPTGYAVAYAYDAADRLVSMIDSRGESVTYTLDGMGNRIGEQVKDANGNIALATTRAIDSLNRLAAMQDAIGNANRFAYDANGELVASTDPLSQSTRQSLDALRRPVLTTFADNASASQSWNALDALTQVTDPKGVTTSYGVNAFGDVTRETSPDIGTVTYQHDAAGNVVASTDAKGNVTTIARDLLGRPITIDRSDQKQTFSYDAMGSVSHFEDGSGSTSYTRDALGRVTAKLQLVRDMESSPSEYATNYSYTAGELTGVRYPSGLTVTYQRAAGRVTQVNVKVGVLRGAPKPVVAFASPIAYTALGQPRSWSWNNGDTASRSFDAAGRMTATEFSSYTWDAASRITGITQQLWTDDGKALTQTPVTWRAGYDSRNRLVSFARDGASTAYTYDANSNRLTAAQTTTSELDLEGEFDQSGAGEQSDQQLSIDTASNRLLGFTQTTTATQDGAPTSSVSTTVAYSVDANGSMTSDGLRTFVYDASGRLSKVEAVRAGEAVGVEYLTNALGQRVFKSDPVVESAASTRGPSPSVTHSFTEWLKDTLGWLFSTQKPGKSRTGLAYVYDEQGNLLGMYGNGSNAARAEQMETIWLPLEDGNSIPIGMVKDGQVYAVHTDHLGTPRLITDAKQAAVWQWPYSGFGDNKPTGVLKTIEKKTKGVTVKRLKATAPVLDAPLRLPGQYYDAESKLAYNWHREYNRLIGRYIQSDGKGLGGGFNRFGYVGGNPLSFTDPRGLNPVGGAYAGAGAGSVFGPVGAVVGGGLGFAAGAWLGWNFVGPMFKDPSRPADMTPIEERQWDRHCKNEDDRCAAIKAATRAAIAAAFPKMNDMFNDPKEMFGTPKWGTHGDGLAGRIRNIAAMISLGKKMGCDMSQEEALAITLMVPLAPK